MSRPESDTDDDRGDREHRDDRDDRESTSSLAEWFAESTLRMALAVVGFVLLLFALGQLVGLDLLGLFVEALSSQVGRWLFVALFALLLIALAFRGFGTGTD